MTASEKLVTQKEKAAQAKATLRIIEHNPQSQQLAKELTLDNFLVKEFSATENGKSPITISVKQDILLLQYCIQGNISVKNIKKSKSTLFKQSEYNILSLKAGDWFVTLNDEESKLIHIYLSEDFFHRYTPNDYSAPLYNLVAIGKLFPRNLYLAPRLKSILYEIDQCEFSNHLKLLYVKAKIIELLTLQLAQYEEEKLIPSALKPQEVEKMIVVKELIENDLGNSPTISSLARAAGTNEQYLKKHFKLLFGSTVFGYITSCKMEKAKELLLSEKYRITEISEMVGYKHATHFTTAFKKFFGYLPQSLKAKMVFGSCFSFGVELQAIEMLMMV
ncbi:MAG: AraC family transcriptional regulator [Pedobacter sp.]|uniref:helix-turn-helix domain-containing protein n=1 Tax=Pedobacter sp. TaxID=1411316 RepID=UPI002807A7CD|nr:AraC family transcriptional regulator [Pedobacter sp.]MDQ8003640.1 AraC family transcriptional regulator [Pedobacter sp.]